MASEVPPVKHCKPGFYLHNDKCWESFLPPKTSDSKIIIPEPAGIHPCGLIPYPGIKTTFTNTPLGGSCGAKGTCQAIGGLFGLFVAEKEWMGNYCVFEPELGCPAGYQLMGTVTKRCVNLNTSASPSPSAASSTTSSSTSTTTGTTSTAVSTSASSRDADLQAASISQEDNGTVKNYLYIKIVVIICIVLSIVYFVLIRRLKMKRK